MLKSTDRTTALRGLSSPATYAAGELNSVIADMEALLIKALGCPSNVANINFPKGTEWFQVTHLDRERDCWIGRGSPSDLATGADDASPEVGSRLVTAPPYVGLVASVPA